MLTIRLQRTGKKNQADFRIVLAEKESPVGKKVVEILGSYNPRKTFQVKEDRVKYWIGQRIELSETMHNLLVTKGFVEGKKVKAFSIPKKPVEAVAPVPLTNPPAGGETPAEAKEATAVVEAAVENIPVEATAAAETPKVESPTPEAPVAEVIPESTEKAE
jgi:small subunit ribosomal protein S16